AIPYLLEGDYGLFTLGNPKGNVEMESLDPYLDSFIESNPESKFAFIHGEEVVTSICSESNNIGFYLPGFKKHEIFKHVLLHGAYPRKTISMGNAKDKRYYLECRRIV
ncbi:MAG: DUF1015 family protein, partial [Candidatus Altiarchaeales archaeon]|nr:DUF1015 family protein [Candidatus Altiarchaeales archaeon]